MFRTPPRPPLRPRLAASALTGAAGLLAVGVGAGLTLPWAAKAGLTGTTVLGGVVLLVGLGLTGWAGVVLLRGRRWFWSLLAVPVVLLLGYVLVLPVAVGVAATHVPPTPLGDRSPADLGLRARDVSVPTADGVRLAAWYVPSRNGVAVVLAHGAGSNRTATLPQAVVLARHGYGVLLLDARGHGESGGRAMDFGWYGERDLAGAVDYLSSRNDVDPDRIGAVGLSMGGEEAIGAAGVDPRIAAVVAEGSQNRVFGDKGYLEAYGVRGRFQLGVEWLTYRFTGLLTDAPEPAPLPEAAAAAAPRPVLLLTAGKRPDEGLAAARIADAAPASVQVAAFPGAGHTGGLQSDPGRWERLVIGFLDRNLR